MWALPWMDHGLMFKLSASQHSSILRSRTSDKHTLLGPNFIKCLGPGITILPCNDPFQ